MRIPKQSGHLIGGLLPMPVTIPAHQTFDLTNGQTQLTGRLALQ